MVVLDMATESDDPTAVASGQIASVKAEL